MNVMARTVRKKKKMEITKRAKLTQNLDFWEKNLEE
jgi:hypothetical protein